MQQMQIGNLDPALIALGLLLDLWLEIIVLG